MDLTSLNKVIFFGFLPLVFFLGHGQNNQTSVPTPNHKWDQPAPYQKRTRELERKIASLQKKLSEITKKLRPIEGVTIVPLKNLDVTQAAEIIQSVSMYEPNVEIDGVPRMNFVAIRAKKRATDNIRKLLHQLDRSAEGRYTVFGGLKRGRLKEQEIMVQILVWRLKQEK